MKIRIAAAAVCAAIGIAAAGIAIAQAAWPQVTAADLQACRPAIAQFHKIQKEWLAKEVATYCTTGGADYRKDICDHRRNWLSLSKGLEDVAWYAESNEHCEDGEYPCFGPAIVNDERSGADYIIKMAGRQPAANASTDLWASADVADNCAAGLWVKKYNAAGGARGGGNSGAQPVQPARPVATAPVKASDPTFQSNLKTFGDQQLLALVDELLSTGNIDVAKLARNALLQRFPDSPLTITVAQRLADAIKTAPAATPPPPPPLAVQSVTSQRVFLNNETAVVQAFAKVGFTIAQSPDNPRELRHDKNYFTVWIADCDTAPCKALQIRGQYLPTPMPSKARLDEWNAGKLYGRGYLSGGFVTFDMIIPIPSKGIDLDDLKESIDRFVTQSDYFYTAVTKP
ncbi:MAG TPA: hypothetical protein PLH23_00330 [Hyphomonadaceae bacterium]|nr:hypothetical protein [Hyphomonadaceae bacterium]